MDNQKYKRLSELLLLCYDGSANAEEIAELKQLLENDRQALEYCVDISMNLNYFHCLGQIPTSYAKAIEASDTHFMSELGPQQQLDLLGDFAEYEKHADTMEIAKASEPVRQQLIQKVHYERPVRTINKYSLTAVVLSAAALLLVLIYVHFAPPAPYEVATISDSIDAEWSSGLPMTPGTRMASNLKPIRLTQGIVKLQTDEQVEIVLEAPAEFNFKSYSEISMNYGKLFAHVSEQGYGFSVVTPNSKIIDLGTEFGVLSHIDGNTEVHLYQGKANVFSSEKQQRKSSQILTAGSAVKVDSHDASIRDIALDEQALVRHIDSNTKFQWRGQKSLRLADLLLGGDGFGTATRDFIEYDSLTGAEVTTAYAWYRNGVGKMAPVAESPYLDVIFVPGSGEADTVISSQGHQFRECPKTTGMYYSNISCYKGWVFFDSLQRTFEQTKKQFGDSGALYLHSNSGLTINLGAVRKTVPGLNISSFSAFAGIIRQGDNTPDFSDVDVWVLVDGQVRTSRQGLTALQGYDIQIDLSDTDKFLTLIVTDGGEIHSEGFPANHYDTCGFAEPVFGLTPLHNNK